MDKEKDDGWRESLNYKIEMNANDFCKEIKKEKMSRTTSRFLIDLDDGGAIH